MPTLAPQTRNLQSEICNLKSAIPLLLLLLAPLANAQTSSGSLISYQGRLTDANGATVADGIYNVTFAIYETSVSKFSQTLPVQTVNGVFTTFLGGGTPLPTFDPAKSYEIGITLGGQELSPRQKITSVPMAQVAASLQPGVNITAGQGVFSGKGTFNGGVESDTQGQGIVTAVNGNSDWTGVRGYSPAATGVWAETQSGRAIYAAAHGGGSILEGFRLSDRVVRIDKDGKGFFNGGTQTGGADYADLVTVKGRSSDYQPGDVMVISDDPARPFTRSPKPYARNVAGIYSTKPGVVGSKRGIADPADNEIPLALTGIVPCKVSCENGPIRMGDLLVTSRTPGYAMKATDSHRMLGAVVGKALQPLKKGRGVIEVLVTLR
ncbi:MAG: hypothetical protein AUJ96_32945 [Armatimonadetes bacterium CG2_30_66_41]|nr:MAG: hypothetical protein AUJ96_32945 [Armatimonadetes bacterium CG2_30_66_41]